MTSNIERLEAAGRACDLGLEEVRASLTCEPGLRSVPQVRTLRRQVHAVVDALAKHQTNGAAAAAAAAAKVLALN